MKQLSCYIHIPFCDHKCIYCDFYSIVTYENTESYFNSLKLEVDNYVPDFRGEYEISTVFFGGGTPSFVDPKYIKDIINHLRKYFAFSEDVEITLETNPGTVDKSKLNEFKSAGINRISVGIQSFNKDELKFLTRIHDKQTAIKTVEDAVSIGLDNVSIDMIFNLPGQTKKIWSENLEEAFNLPVKHISAYSLILERGTILNKMVLDGKVELQDADYDADLYEFTIDQMNENGFAQYEVSNFCKPGYECRHNLAYWLHREYLGLGTSAHSFVGNRRWWNYSSLKMYIESVKAKGNDFRSGEELSKSELLDEYVMLNLRGPGLDLTGLSNKYGNNWERNNNSYLSSLLEDGYITRTDNFIKFTKKGYALCDEILTNFS